MSDSDVLTDLAFNILVALRGEALHGYALVKRLRTLEGRGGLRTGTVYAALARLEKDGLVEETDAPRGPDDDPRRRYYTLTEPGVEAARTEARRLATVLEQARAKALFDVAAERG